MNQYETVRGTDANQDEQHEARLMKRTTPDGIVQMMSEIGDGVFVAWSTCRSCRNQIVECACPGGPVEPEYMQKWRDERFTKSFDRRGALPALPELLRTRDRRIDAVVRLLRSKGWCIEPPAETVAVESELNAVELAESDVTAVAHAGKAAVGPSFQDEPADPAEYLPPRPDETCPVCGQSDNCGDCDHRSVTPGWKWFLNEEGEPYDYDPAKQEDEFPDDFHTPYDTYPEAEEASLALDRRRQERFDAGF